jgi:putative tryptophan/tyrosine transport system substrate-binding protein
MQSGELQRREFITLVGGAAMWPSAARAQQPGKLPTIGLLHAGYPEGETLSVAGFRQGLRETGYIEGRNVAIEYRWAKGQRNLLPSLAADLVRRQVTVIFTLGFDVALAAIAATTTIPIVFSMGEDPVKAGVVASLNRPGANVTGLSIFTNLLFGKRLQLLHETVPKTAVVAFLVNPDNPNSKPDTLDAQTAADALGRELRVVMARNENEFDQAFAPFLEYRVGALLVGADSVFVNRREALVTLAARYAVPAMYERREFPASGGLMSYGVSFVDAWRHCGVYAGRILRGERPGDLPVLQPTKFDFVINLKTAKALGLVIPPGVLAIADEVID